MYREQFQIRGQAIADFLHGAPLDGLRRLPPGSVFINGVDVAGPDFWDLYGAGKDGEPVTVEARAQDPQTERDLAHLAMGIINHERNLWPQNEGHVPAEAVNQWANLVRAVPHFRLNLPQEGASPIPDEQLRAVSQRFGSKKTGTGAPLSGEMTTASTERTARWAVVSLGELQQPGGVGEIGRAHV